MGAEPGTVWKPAPRACTQPPSPPDKSSTYAGCPLALTSPASDRTMLPMIQSFDKPDRDIVGLAPSCSAARGTPSEIQLVGGGNVIVGRCEIISRSHEIAFLADVLAHTHMPLFSLPTVIVVGVVTPDALPGLLEGVRVLRRHMDF